MGAIKRFFQIIVLGNTNPPTDKQVQTLKKLGLRPGMKISKPQASRVIDSMVNWQAEEPKAQDWRQKEENRRRLEKLRLEELQKGWDKQQEQSR